ncbi:MAG: DJ-1/PfpI family protein, partial [Prevotella sp.]
MKMAKVYQFMGNGFEDIEAVAVVDILRRGGIDIKTVSVTGDKYVQTAHGITLKTDMMFEESDFGDADLLMLPGGMAPGAASLNEHEGLLRLIVEHYNRGGKIAA